MANPGPVASEQKSYLEFAWLMRSQSQQFNDKVFVVSDMIHKLLEAENERSKVEEGSQTGQ